MCSCCVRNNISMETKDTSRSQAYITELTLGSICVYASTTYADTEKKNRIKQKRVPKNLRTIQIQYRQLEDL